MADTIQIEFSGLDVVYDGSAIVDAGVEADELTTMTFSVDGTPVGPTLLSDISADIAFGPVAGIPVGGGTVNTGPDSGTFELLVPGVALSLDLNDVAVTYVPLGYVDFVFAGTLAEISGQNLPFSLTLGNPVTVSFSTQVLPGTVTNDGTSITGFAASGTGEVRGVLVPEPTSIALLLLGGLGLALCWRRR